MKDSIVVQMKNITDMFTVSVIMATFNGEKYIREQLDSIIAQTYPIYELIIQDDCSTDSTVSICREYESKFNFIHVYVNKHNKGYNENFKSCAMKATGDLIAISDQDDIWFSEKIAKQVSAIGSHTMCYSQHLRGESVETSFLVDYKNAPERHMFKAVVGHSMLLKREFIQDKNSWPGTLAYDIWLTILANYRDGVVRIAEPLNWHRSHENQASLNKYGNSISIWKPYIYGLIEYKKRQKEPGWTLFHQRILQESKGKNPLTFKMSKLLLSRNTLALLQLCFICYKYRKTIYPSNNTNGLMGHIRSFCYPLIHGYYSTDFYGG